MILWVLIGKSYIEQFVHFIVCYKYQNVWLSYHFLLNMFPCFLVIFSYFLCVFNLEREYHCLSRLLSAYQSLGPNLIQIFESMVLATKNVIIE